MVSVSLVILCALVFGAAPSELWAEQPEVIPFDELRIFFEENATDGDLGIHALFDGEAWDITMIISPDWRRIFWVRAKGSVGEIGLTELFFESEEPSFDDLPREEFIALFREGEYYFIGKTVEGDWLFGEATLTHDMPAEPEIVSPTEDAEVDPDADLTIEWVTVPDPDPPDSVIEAYQIVAEKDEDEERLRVFSVDMLSTDTSVTVPSEFFEPGKDYKVEVLAVETSGNQTISEVPFATEEP
jgi:hypothetical protein